MRCRTHLLTYIHSKNDYCEMQDTSFVTHTCKLKAAVTHILTRYTVVSQSTSSVEPGSTIAAVDPETNGCLSCIRVSRIARSTQSFHRYRCHLSSLLEIKEVAVPYLIIELVPLTHYFLKPLPLGVEQMHSLCFS